MLPRTRGLMVVVTVGFLSALAAWPAIACVVGTGTSASCSEAVLDACLPGGGSFDGSVTFACGGAATITVTSTKTISANTTIDGGSVITISGGMTVGVFSVNSGVTFTVENLTIADGRGSGGAINNSGTVNVTNSTFSGNSAPAGNGGAIYTQPQGPPAALTVNGCTFYGNSAPVAYCGAIYIIGATTVSIANSTFAG